MPFVLQSLQSPLTHYRLLFLIPLGDCDSDFDCTYSQCSVCRHMSSLIPSTTLMPCLSLNQSSQAKEVWFASKEMKMNPFQGALGGLRMAAEQTIVYPPRRQDKANFLLRPQVSPAMPTKYLGAPTFHSRNARVSRSDF